MQKSLIDLYMTRISSGDLSCVERLCQQLYDRLVYIPAIAVRSSGRMVNVEVVRLSSGEKRIVPIFTSEKRLKTWRDVHPEVTESISVLGGDLFSVLRPDVGVIIDPGVDHSVTLESEALLKIGEVARDDEFSSQLENRMDESGAAEKLEHSTPRTRLNDDPPSAVGGEPGDHTNPFSVVSGFTVSPNPVVGAKSVETFDPDSEEYAFEKAENVGNSAMVVPPKEKRSFFALFGGKK